MDLDNLRKDKIHRKEAHASLHRIPDEALSFSELILRYAKEGVPSGIIAKYDVRPVDDQQTLSNTRRANIENVFFDGDRALFLTYQGIGAAFISYQKTRKAEGALLVKQIQGVPGKQLKLQPLRWEVLLISALIQYARSLPGIQQILIQPAEQHGFYASPSLPYPSGSRKYREESKRIQEMMRLRYNKMPERIGFEWDEDLQVRKYVISKNTGAAAA